MPDDNLISLAIPDKTKPVGVHLRRNSMGTVNGSNNSESILPHYLRPSTGSCHDFCKFGRDRGFDPKPRYSMLKTLKDVSVPPEKKKTAAPAKPLLTSKSFDSGEKYCRSKSVIQRETLNDGKKTLMVKTRPSISSKTPKSDYPEAKKLEMMKSKSVKGSSRSSFTPKPSGRIVSTRKQKSLKVESDQLYYGEVQEKTLYVIKIETEKKPQIMYKNGDDDQMGSSGKMDLSPGKVVEAQSPTSSPRKLKFRRGRRLGENQNMVVDGRGRKLKKVEEVECEESSMAEKTEKVVLRHQDLQGKKDCQGLFNKVIKATASKLVETRKSKVKALVGAFETVISLQESKISGS